MKVNSHAFKINMLTDLITYEEIKIPEDQYFGRH